MSEEKNTFTDPETGEEIESTWLARGVGYLSGSLELVWELGLGVLVGVSLGGWLGGLFGERGFGAVMGGIWSGMLGLLWGLVTGAAMSEGLHDSIARRQHRRRQRKLQRQLLEEAWAGVPNGALSRAPQTPKPEPSAAALSRNKSESRPSLTEAAHETKDSLELSDK